MFFSSVLDFLETVHARHQVQSQSERLIYWNWSQDMIYPDVSPAPDLMFSICAFDFSLLFFTLFLPPFWFSVFFTPEFRDLYTCMHIYTHTSFLLFYWFTRVQLRHKSNKQTPLGFSLVDIFLKPIFTPYLSTGLPYPPGSFTASFGWNQLLAHRLWWGQTKHAEQPAALNHIFARRKWRENILLECYWPWLYRFYGGSAYGNQWPVVNFIC